MASSITVQWLTHKSSPNIPITCITCNNPPTHHLRPSYNNTHTDTRKHEIPTKKLRRRRFLWAFGGQHELSTSVRVSGLNLADRIQRRFPHSRIDIHDLAWKLALVVFVSSRSFHNLRRVDPLRAFTVVREVHAVRFGSEWVFG